MSTSGWAGSLCVTQAVTSRLNATGRGGREGGRFVAVRHPLGELIATIQQRDDLSFDKIVAQARAAGFEISRSNVGRLKDDPVKRIPVDTLHALAAGLRVPVGMVIRAALASAGVSLDQPSVRTPEQAVQEDALLSQRDKEAIIALIQAMRHSNGPTRRAL